MTSVLRSPTDSDRNWSKPDFPESHVDNLSKILEKQGLQFYRTLPEVKDKNPPQFVWNEMGVGRFFSIFIDVVVIVVLVVDVVDVDVVLSVVLENTIIVEKF